MHVSKNDIDSSVVGRAALDLYDVDQTANFSLFEDAYRQEYDPSYVAAKLPIDDLASIQFLERHGFAFVETQLRLTHRLRGPYVTHGPYRFERVTEAHAAEEVLAIAAVAFTQDRFSVDPGLGEGRQLAGERYRRYVLQSLERPDERVYRLLNADSGETVAFKTHRIVNPTEALMLLGGVRPDCQAAGVAVISGYHEFNELLQSGVRRFTTHVSVRNLAVVNLEVSSMGFRVKQAFVVLRKLYPRIASTRVASAVN
jgi:hypothetical protein